jgi:hypothetical protein
MSDEKTKPKNIRCLIPVHCAHTGFMDPEGTQTKSFEPEAARPEEACTPARRRGPKRLGRSGSRRQPPSRTILALTMGLVKIGGGNADGALLDALGLTFKTLKIPNAIGTRIGETGWRRASPGAAISGFEIADCRGSGQPGARPIHRPPPQSR